MDTTELVQEGSNDELVAAEAVLLTEAQINALGREPLPQQLESAKQCILSLAELYNEHTLEKAKIPEIKKKAEAIIDGDRKWCYACFSYNLGPYILFRYTNSTGRFFFR